MPGVRPARFWRTSKEKTEMPQTRSPTNHPQRPVLIVAGKMRRVGAPLAHDIHRLAGAQFVDFDPRLQSNGIALREIKNTLWPWIFDLITSTLSIKLNGRVVRLKIRKLRRTRSRLIPHHVANRNQRSRLFLTKIQLQHRLGIIGIKSQTQGMENRRQCECSSQSHLKTMHGV